MVQRYVESRVLAAIGRRSVESIRASGKPGSEQTIIKLEWSLLAQRLSDTALTVAGAAAVAGENESPARNYLTQRSATIAGGTTEILSGVIARRVLGLPG
ncbi:acyl-CoA dehydrogenase family protein [Rhodococcus sp. (in: high G+C Gram-positive bacteria)]|uniref:acyl-CoA dehydrogenase family protein n=1 Tax=Rhodococcus sp. TaxID=1831 RepID=UPI003BB1B5B1